MNQPQQEPSVLEVRPAAQRGETDLGWLRSRHSFSFGRYHDPGRMGLGVLRVLNDDRVAPGGGFAEHGHADMEIITWVLDGALAHRDDTGERGVLEPGDAQVMSAGRGIRHSEMNASQAEPVWFLQVWIEPSARGVAPAYAQKRFDPAGRRGRWQPIASPDAREGSLAIHQDAVVSVAELRTGERAAVSLGGGRRCYLHAAEGHAMLGGVELRGGDAAVLASGSAAGITARADSRLLLFDLP